MLQTHTENKELTEASTLRQKAEEQLKKERGGKAIHLAEGDTVKLLHELEVHQIELEMQNEELRMAIEKADAATEKFTTLYDFAPSGYLTLDRDCKITQLNFNAAKMLGMERGNLINHSLKHFISRDAQGIFHNFYQKVFESDLKQTCELKLENGAEPPAFIYLEGLVSDDSRYCYITAIDNTERHRAEEDLKENESRLKELNATKDKFFSIIAHDLRNPFTSIIGFSNLLADQIEKKDYDSIDKYSKIIYESSLRAMDLLKNLMEWAHVQTGKIQFNPKPIEINNIIDSITELLNAVARQKSIKITREIHPHVTILADEEMISTVMRNLISNAIKFTRPGGEIIISALEKQDELIVAVCDNGIGIEQNNIEKLFLIDGSYSTRGTQNEEGTGLGLILCKEFILKHRGKLWVESAPGKGSKFFFSIPNSIH